MPKAKSAPPVLWKNCIVGYGSEDPRQLVANDKNWRIHPRAQELALSEVFHDVGLCQNIVVNKRSGKVVDGHLRVALAVAEGQPALPITYVDLTDEQEALILASMDPLSAMAETDTAKLTDLLSKFSIPAGALADMLGTLAPPTSKQGLTDDDAVPEVQDEPVTTLGDCWLLGAHRLVCGDSTEAEVVRRVLGADVPFLMVTDPPYGVDLDPEWRQEAGLQNNTRQSGEVKNDDRADWTDAYRLFPGSVAYVWHASLRAIEFGASLIAAGFEIRACIIWAKQALQISRGHYHWQHEPCWYAVRKGKTANWLGDRKQSTLWSIPSLNGNGNREEEATGHGTQKPLELMRRPILNHTSPGDMVYDPFVGSGTTIIACEKEGRICRAIELDPKYCDVIVRRWEAFTGMQATLDGTGQTFSEVEQERRAVAA